MQRAVLIKRGRSQIIVTQEGQSMKWSDGGRRLELWQDEPLSLVKRWPLKNVAIVEGV